MKTRETCKKGEKCETRSDMSRSSRSSRKACYEY